MLVTQLCLILCDFMDYNLPASSVCGILQERILEWVAIPYSRGSSQPKDQTWTSCIADRFFFYLLSHQRNPYYVRVGPKSMMVCL